VPRSQWRLRGGAPSPSAQSKARTLKAKALMDRESEATKRYLFGATLAHELTRKLGAPAKAKAISKLVNEAMAGTSARRHDDPETIALVESHVVKGLETLENSRARVQFPPVTSTEGSRVASPMHRPRTDDATLRSPEAAKLAKRPGQAKSPAPTHTKAPGQAARDLHGQAELEAVRGNLASGWSLGSEATKQVFDAEEDAERKQWAKAQEKARKKAEVERDLAAKFERRRLEAEEDRLEVEKLRRAEGKGLALELARQEAARRRKLEERARCAENVKARAIAKREEAEQAAAAERAEQERVKHEQAADQARARERRAKERQRQEKILAIDLEKKRALEAAILAEEKADEARIEEFQKERDRIVAQKAAERQRHLEYAVAMCEKNMKAGIGGTLHHGRVKTPELNARVDKEAAAREAAAEARLAAERAKKGEVRERIALENRALLERKWADKKRALEEKRKATGELEAAAEAARSVWL